jgi:hypothetical protein
MRFSQAVKSFRLSLRLAPEGKKSVYFVTIEDSFGEAGADGDQTW